MLIMALFIQLLIPIGMVTSAGTAPVNITNVSITESDEITVIDAVYNPGYQLSLGQQVVVHYDWELPGGHGAAAGSTYEFDLPAEFKLFNDVDGNLVTSEGSVGTFNVSKTNNKVTMTFNNNITQLSNIGGTMMIWSVLGDYITGNASPYEIDFSVGGFGKIIPLNITPKGGSLISKSGQPDHGYNGTKIFWEVDINTVLQSVYGALLTDPIPSGLELDTSSVKIRELNVDVQGGLSVGNEVTGSIVDNSDVSQLNLDFGHIDSSAYRINYTTNVVDTWEGPKTFANTATLTGTGVNQDAQASVSISRGETLNKSSKGYNNVDHTMTWEIQFNYNGNSSSAADVVLQDRFFIPDEPNLEVVVLPGSFEVYEIVLDGDGEEDESSSQLVTTGYTITPVDSITNDGHIGFDFQFDPLHIPVVNKPYKIVYQTQVNDKVYNNRKVNNTITLENTTFSATAWHDISQGILLKSHGNVNNGTLDYESKTIDWTLTFNRNNFDMEDVVITDSFTNKGLELDPSSLTVTGYVYGTDYSLSPLSGSWKNGFIIEFESGVNVNAQTTVTYTTTFTPDERDNKNSWFGNTAMLAWKEINVDQDTKTINRTFTPDDYTRANGFKNGAYNAFDKVITWNIGINYNKSTINQAIVEDFLLQDQQLVPNSIQVHYMDLTGGTNGVNEGAAADSSEYTIDDNITNGTNPGFKISFNAPIDTPYWITYKTSLDGLIVDGNYTNTAVLYDNTNPLTTLTASVPVEHGTEYVFKDGDQNQDNALLIDWEVWINRGQSDLPANATIFDTPSPNQILMEDTFEIYGTNVASNGTVTKNPAQLLTEGEGQDYILKIVTDAITGHQTFDIEFLNAFNNPYVLEYQSFINAAHDALVENKVDFEGGGTANISDNSPHSFRVELSGGSGTGSGVVGSITVNKVDADNNQPLAGAEFSLYFKSNNQFLRTLTTDANGEAVFDNLLLTDYILVENQAPTNYVVNVDNEHEVNLVAGNDASENKTIEISNTHQDSPSLLGRLGDYVWLDSDKDGTQDEGIDKGVNGVVVELYEVDVNNDIYTKIDDTETDDKNGEPGYYLFDKLPEGHYQVCFKLPDGYAFTEHQAGNDTALDSDADTTIVPYANDPSYGCSDVVFLPAGGEDLTLDAGLILGSIGNYVWLDYDKNGIQDENPANGVNGVTVELYKEDTNGDFIHQQSKDILTANKDGDSNKPGYYLFDELVAGNYKVCFKLPEGYAFTELKPSGDPEKDSNANTNMNSPDYGCSGVIELAAGEDNMTIDAGLILGSIGNYVWRDTNRNGIQDEDPANGVNGVTVELYKDDGNGNFVHQQHKDTLTANKDGDPDQPGYYLFDELVAGNYKVCFKLPDDYAFTSLQEGNNTGLDSDANTTNDPYVNDPSYGCSDVVVLPAGKDDLTIDAGLVLGRIGDYTWLDSNRNGIQDEPVTSGINGIIVELYKEDANGDYVYEDETVTTYKDGEPGYYLFDELLPGNYNVCFKRPNNYRFTNEFQGNDLELDSNATPLTAPYDSDSSYGCSGEIILPAGGEDLTIDAGFVRRNTGGGGFVPPIDPEEEPVDPEDPEYPEDPRDPEEDPQDPEEESSDPEDPRDPEEDPTEDPKKEEVTTPQDTPITGGCELPNGGTISIGEQLKNGTVTIDDDCNWTYTPNEGFVGEDSFTIVVTDEDGNVEEQFIDIDVEEVPLGTIDLGKNDSQASLPQTGESTPISIWIGLMLCALAIGSMLVRKLNLK